MLVGLKLSQQPSYRPQPVFTAWGSSEPRSRRRRQPMVSAHRQSLHCDGDIAGDVALKLTEFRSQKTLES